MTDKHPLQSCGLKYSTLPNIPPQMYEDLEKALCPDCPDLPLTPIEKYPVTDLEFSKAFLVIKEALEDKKYYCRISQIIIDAVEQNLIPNRIIESEQFILMPEDNIGIVAKQISVQVLNNLKELV